ncbi:MAG: MBL fold metallo-hydrolase [Anaerolineae bacterium]
MQEIFPGLYVITRTATNCYLIESAPDELILIDAGLPGMTGFIARELAKRGYHLQQIKHIIITHADIDHIGSLAKLAQKTGATVHASEESAPYIHNASAPPHVPAPMRALTGFLQKSAQVDETFSDQHTLPFVGGIRALHVPGHTPENYNLFWEREGVLFAADLFFTLTHQVTLSPRLITWDHDALLASARKALDLAPRYICAGHGAPVNVQQAPERLNALRRQLEGRSTFAAT